MNYKSSRCFLPSSKSIGLSVPKKKLKTDFKDSGHGRHLGFLIGTNSAILNVQTLMLSTKFQVNWPFRSGEEAKNRLDFQDGSHRGHLRFLIRSILAMFDLQVLPGLKPVGSGKEVKNRFSRWRSWRTSWFSDRNDLTIFDLLVTLMLPTKLHVNWPFGSGEAVKNRFASWLLQPPFWISDRNDFIYF